MSAPVPCDVDAIFCKCKILLQFSAIYRKAKCTLNIWKLSITYIDQKADVSLKLVEVNSQIKFSQFYWEMRKIK